MDERAVIVDVRAVIMMRASNPQSVLGIVALIEMKKIFKDSY